MLNRNYSLTLNLLLKKYSHNYKKLNYISDFDLAFQWNIPEIKKLVNQIKYSKSVCEGYFSEEFEVNTNQPVWDMRVPDIEDYNEPPIGQPKPSKDTNKSTTFERLGYYIHAHKNLDEYGIYLNTGCLKNLSKEIESLSGLKNDDISVIVAIEKVYWHEITHAWIEDLCSICEDIYGYDFYTPIIKKYNCYIFMEEAICNSCSVGMLIFLLQSHKQKDILIYSIKKIMNKQPKGYRDYLSLNWWSTNDKLFQKNVYKLLTDIYLVPKDLALFSIQLFFGHGDFTFNTSNRYKNFLRMQRKRDYLYTELYLKYSKYPSYLK